MLHARSGDSNCLFSPEGATLGSQGREPPVREKHETWPEKEHFAWQSGYGAFSVSRSGVDEVQAYITNQEAHHARLSFEEEFVAFLRRYGVPYDEKYVWG